MVNGLSLFDERDSCLSKDTTDIRFGFANYMHFVPSLFTIFVALEVVASNPITSVESEEFENLRRLPVDLGY